MTRRRTTRLDARAASAAAGWTAPRIAAPRNGPAAMPRNVRAAMRPEGARPADAGEQVRRGRGRDRDERPAADRLEEPGGDQELEGRGHAGEQAADREHHQRPEEHAPRAPQVGEATGERHRHHRHQQVAVDDPRRLPEARPAGDVGDDRGQRDGRDHELEAGEEHAAAHDREQEEGLAAGDGLLGDGCHAASVGRLRQPPGRRLADEGSPTVRVARGFPGAGLCARLPPRVCPRHPHRPEGRIRP